MSVPETDEQVHPMVGRNYQAEIPERLDHYDDAVPYEGEDKLVWDPSVPGVDVEDYLKKAAAIREPRVPIGAQAVDHEQSLYVLQQCGHNVEEALRRLRMAVDDNTAEPTHQALWSEEECRQFESGMKRYGKDFRKIQQKKLPTKSVGELIQFYYLWKISGRYSVFGKKAK